MFCHIKSRYLDGARMFAAALTRLEGDDARRQPVIALLLVELGWINIRLGQFEEAARRLNASQAIYRRLDLPPLPGQATDPRLGLSALASIRGDYDQAERLAEQARQTAVAQNHLNNLPTALYLLASIASAQGRYAQAQSFARRPMTPAAKRRSAGSWPTAWVKWATPRGRWGIIRRRSAILRPATPCANSSPI
jgi:tetratricopeptide (TPR) repeat protein